MEASHRKPLSVSCPQWLTKDLAVAITALAGICIYLIGVLAGFPRSHTILIGVLLLGGIPVCSGILLRLIKGEFSTDSLALVSILVAVTIGEYLAGSIIVLMLSGGQALENYSIGRASSALAALAKRMPSVAHKVVNGNLQEIALSGVEVGDSLMILPHEVVPADGEVQSGYSTMDESFLTGEPYMLSKGPGSDVLAGAVNGEAAVTIRVARLPIDSRYEKIVEVMRRAEKERPRMRRLADRLGSFYTPFSLGVATLAWLISGDTARFLSVCVIATPCPLLIAVPVAIIATISLAARRGIIIKNPAVLERIGECTTLILDKTGTLTYGAPVLTAINVCDSFSREELLQFAASLEQYSRHPLAHAIKEKAAGVALLPVERVSEKPGTGLSGIIQNKHILITGRSKLSSDVTNALPPPRSGLECIMTMDGLMAGTFEFHDAPRDDSPQFIRHLVPSHKITRTMIASGDRESEVSYLASLLGITEYYASTSPEDKVSLVKKESANAKTIFIGDGINDAPALASAYVGIAFGLNGDVATEAAGAVILDRSLNKVDELFHIGLRLRQIVLQSTLGGMVLSMLGMALAFCGLLSPVAGAIGQEVIDVLAILNALRASIEPEEISDIEKYKEFAPKSG